MKRIRDVYDKLQINGDHLRKAIENAETPVVKKRTYRIPAIAACAAALMLAVVFTAVLIRPVGTDDPVSAERELDFDAAARFVSPGVKSEDDGLIMVDGVALWIEGAYYDGRTMTVAVKGEAADEIKRYDTLRSSVSDARCTVNGSQATLTTQELTLKKHIGFFEGIMELKTDIDESVVVLEIEFPTLAFYCGDTLVRTVNQRIGMKNMISRVYTDDTDALMCGNTEILYVSNAAAWKEGSVGDAPVGMSLSYYVPDSVYLGENGRNVRAKVIDEDGSELTYLRGTHMTNATGEINTAEFSAPVSRNVGIVLYDEKTGEVLYACSARLNDPEKELVLED